MAINELEIKLNLYDEICREFYEKNWGNDEWRTHFATEKIIKYWGNEIAFSCRIEDLLSFIADKYNLDSNCMVVSFVQSGIPAKSTRGDYPRFFSKYELAENEMDMVQAGRVSIMGYSDMPQHQLVDYYDGTIGSKVDYYFTQRSVRNKKDLFEKVSWENCFSIYIDSLFDFAEPQADGKPLLEHCRVSCSSADFSDSNSPDYHHTSQLILESDPYDVFLHIPVSFLANERRRDDSTAYQLLSSYFESVQEKETAAKKKKA